jgi:hypothetical protein
MRERQRGEEEGDPQLGHWETLVFQTALSHGGERKKAEKGRGYLGNAEEMTPGLDRTPPKRLADSGSESPLQKSIHAKYRHGERPNPVAPSWAWCFSDLEVRGKVSRQWRFWHGEFEEGGDQENEGERYEPSNACAFGHPETAQ